MLKKLLIAFLFLSLFFPSRAFAADPQFDIAVNSTYEINSQDLATITQVITITNKTEFYFTPTYTVTVGFKNVENVESFNKDGTIPTTISEKDSNTKSIKLSFPKRYAGLSEKNTFTLRFTTKDVVKKQGAIREITIPGIDDPDSFSSYTIEVVAPKEFGNASIIKPFKELSQSSKITLSKEEIGKAGVYIQYGDEQFYHFRINYNISNPNLFPVKTEIALPPETNYQEVLISGFSEAPLNVTRDPDGNWIAEYRLLPQQKKKIEVKGYVKTGTIAREEMLSSRQLKEYTDAKKYWDSNDPKMKSVVEKLKTPRDIYDYVVRTLTYNYSKVATDNLRLGGLGALNEPKNSVCLEFSDLFITLARAKGIPARSVEGFAYTNNSKLRPLSLVSDILHAWPEYYDAKEKKWIMVDPTWGNTTKGMDYFGSLDFSHVAFAVKGFDSEYPIPAGGYKFNEESKDVKIEFAKREDFKKTKGIQITDSFPTYSFPKVTIQGSFTIKNTGNTPVANTKAYIKTATGITRDFTIDYIPPYGVKKITTSFADVPFLTNKDYIITMQFADTVYKRAIRISFIPDFKIVLIIGGLIGGSTIIGAITFHTGSILVQRRKRKNSIRR